MVNVREATAGWHGPPSVRAPEIAPQAHPGECRQAARTPSAIDVVISRCSRTEGRSVRKNYFSSCSQFLWQHAVIDKLVYRGWDTCRPALAHYRSVLELDFAWFPVGNITLQRRRGICRQRVNEFHSVCDYGIVQQYTVCPRNCGRLLHA